MVKKNKNRDAEPMETESQSPSQLYMPGDVLPISLNSINQVCQPVNTNLKSIDGKKVLGPGLRVVDDQIVATRAGIFKNNQQANTFWIDTAGKRYVPVKGDKVIGIVTSRLTEGWKLDIGCAENAFVSALSFEGSSKKNKPNVKVGDLVYCQLMIAMKDMEPEVVCMGSDLRARGLGVLPTGGMLFTTSLRLARRLLSAECALLKTLGQPLKFEVTIGMNGRVWIKSYSGKQTILISHALKEAETLVDDDDIKQLADRTLALIQGF